MTLASAPRRAFGERLRDIVADRGNLCLGIDPHPALLRDWGLSVDATGVEEFSLRALEAFGNLAAAVKPQVALYEEYGSAGIAVLERVLGEVAERGALSIADAKRGDIGSTMAAYARAWLADSSPLACDALTVSPYLGVGSLDPAFELASATGRGLFVLARTSNPEAGEFQNATMAASDHRTDPLTVAQAVVDAVGQRNASYAPALGPCGVVVGATLSDPPSLARLGGPVLMPGVGAQGGTLDDVRRIAGPTLGDTLVNISREVLRQGPDVASIHRAARQLQKSYRFA